MPGGLVGRFGLETNLRTVKVNYRGRKSSYIIRGTACWRGIYDASLVFHRDKVQGKRVWKCARGGGVEVAD